MPEPKSPAEEPVGPDAVVVPETRVAAAPADPTSDAPDADADAEAAVPTTPAAATPADLSPAACGARLAELFPMLFGKHRALPLKLRIQADIQQRAPGVFSKKSLSAFLHRHTTSTAYLISLTQAPHRFDLDGSAAGDLADEHRAAANEELARRRSMHEARRAAEHAAQQQQRAAAQRERAAEDGARRERALLLRAFETTTLTPANFCALKGLAEDQLQAALTLARQEREPRPAAEAAPAQRVHPGARSDRPNERPNERAGGRPGERQDTRHRRPRRNPPAGPAGPSRS